MKEYTEYLDNLNLDEIDPLIFDGIEINEDGKKEAFLMYITLMKIWRLITPAHDN